MTKWRKVTIGCVVVIIALGILKDQLIRGVIVTAGSSIIGAPLKIDGFSLSVITQKVRIKGLKLYNPEGFPQETLLDIPEISIDLDLPAMLKGDIHIPYIVVDVKSMTVIKNKDGKLNVESLKIVEEQKEAGAKDAGQVKEQKKPSKMPLRIDYMRLNIGEVVNKDYQRSDPPAVTAFSVGVHNKEFKNIKSAEQLVALVMVECLGPTGIKTAGLYAAASVLGVAFLPAGIAGIILGDDNASADYELKPEAVYDEVMKILRANNAKLKSQDKDQGLIKAVVQSCDVVIKISIFAGKSKVTVTARRMLIPKPEVAGGIIHQLSERIR